MRECEGNLGRGERCGMKGKGEGRREKGRGWHSMGWYGLGWHGVAM